LGYKILFLVKKPSPSLLRVIRCMPGRFLGFLYHDRSKVLWTFLLWHHTQKKTYMKQTRGPWWPWNCSPVYRPPRRGQF
jgi:hypothetical protein